MVKSETSRLGRKLHGTGWTLLSRKDDRDGLYVQIMCIDGSETPKQVLHCEVNATEETRKTEKQVD